MIKQVEHKLMGEQSTSHAGTALRKTYPMVQTGQSVAVEQLRQFGTQTPQTLRPETVWQ